MAKDNRFAAIFGAPAFTLVNKPARKAKKGNDMYRDLAEVRLPVMGKDGKPTQIALFGRITAKQVNGQGKWIATFSPLSSFYQSALDSPASHATERAEWEKSVMVAYVAHTKETGNVPSAIPESAIELDL